MDKFTPQDFTDFLGRIEKLKSVPRHCVTADGVTETVAGHSWRTAMMAYLLKDQLGPVDIDKVIRMCLIHDLGEAVTGDIPTFEKTNEHEAAEEEALDKLLRTLPEPLYREYTALFAEMAALETKEAIVYKALDKLEAVIQHNESDISTWLPLEYDLQQTYAAEIVKGYPFLEGLQQTAVQRTRAKIAAADTAGPDEKTRKKMEQRALKAEQKQQKKALRSLVWAERKKECNLLTHLAPLVMLATFVILAIDQVGVYSFLAVWLFIALMATSVILLLVGVILSARHKRSGIFFGIGITGILLCAAWFIFLFFSQGFGLNPIFG